MSLDYARKREMDWPDRDLPYVIVSTEARPHQAPAEPKSVKELVSRLVEGGWEARVGYSLVWKRAISTGTYRPYETFGVWSGPHPSGWRSVACYSRYSDSGLTLGYFPDTKTFEEIKPRTDKPGTWGWSCTIFAGFTRHHVTVTDLKEFAEVRGSVLPSWFKMIHDRFEAQKQAAKDRPVKTTKEVGG